MYYSEHISNFFDTIKKSPKKDRESRKILYLDVSWSSRVIFFLKSANLHMFCYNVVYDILIKHMQDSEFFLKYLRKERKRLLP